MKRSEALRAVLCGTLLILAGCVAPAPPEPEAGVSQDQVSRSNGEQIYTAATSQSGVAITADLGMGMMPATMATCASCHGTDGRGGQGRVMMRTFDAPDIRYSTLVSQDMGLEQGEQADEHPPYNDETIRRAITEGASSSGEPLAWPMPLWAMSGDDLNDLLEYLKTLP